MNRKTYYQEAELLLHPLEKSKFCCQKVWFDAYPVNLLEQQEAYLKRSVSITQEDDTHFVSLMDHSFPSFHSRLKG